MTIAFIVALAGGVIYVMPAPAKVTELGRITFFVGLLWLVYAIGRGAIHF